jgi:hypothetical protein
VKINICLLRLDYDQGNIKLKQISVMTTKLFLFSAIAILATALPTFPRPFPPGVSGVEINHANGKMRTYLELMPRKGNVARMKNTFYIGTKLLSSSIWLVDCANRKMIAKYERYQNIWKADGNLWYSTNTPEPVYNDSVFKYFEYACNGVVPENGVMWN